MNKLPHKFSFSALGVAVVLAATPAHASECEPFPKLKLWSGYTHERVQAMVDRKLDGNWDKFVARLEARLKAVQDIRDSGKTLTLKHKGKPVSLRGKKLGLYLAASRKRLAVVQCLADEAAAEKFQNFATAAGTEEDSDREIVETAAVRGALLQLDVEGRCLVGGEATFKITNLGKAWPKLGTVGLYRLGNGDPQKISARRMRFAKDQFATFKVKASKNATGQLGLFVDPSWSERPFKFDATLTCR